MLNIGWAQYHMDMTTIYNLIHASNLSKIFPVSELAFWRKTALPLPLAPGNIGVLPSHPSPSPPNPSASPNPVAFLTSPNPPTLPTFPTPPMYTTSIQNSQAFPYACWESLPPDVVVVLATFVLFNHHGAVWAASQQESQPEEGTLRALPAAALFSNINLLVCLGMPPNYAERFKVGLRYHGISRHSEQWKSFLEDVAEGLRNVNVVAGLLLTSSVVVVAITELAGFTRFLTMGAIGTSLSCVTIGCNPALKKSLLEMAYIPSFPDKNTKRSIMSVARGLDKQYYMLLFSIYFLFASLLSSEIQKITCRDGCDSPHSSLTFSILGLTAVAIPIVFALWWNVHYVHGNFGRTNSKIAFGSLSDV